MSVLIEALRNAEAARARPDPEVQVAVSPQGEAAMQQLPVRRIAAGAVLAATIVASGLAWWWLRNDEYGAVGVPTRPALGASFPAQQTTASDSDASSRPAESTEAQAQSAPVAAAPHPARVARRTPAAPTRPREAAGARTAATPANAPSSSAAEPASSNAGASAKQRIERGVAPNMEAAYRALRAGRFDEAHKLYEALVAQQPDRPDAWLGLAAAAEARGDVAAAIAGYRRALQIDADNADALAALAELTATGETSAQVSALRLALVRRPDAPSLHAALGRLLAREGRWSEAKAALESAYALAPRRADYAFNLAVTLDRLGERARARALYERAADAAEQEPIAGVDAAGARARAAQLAAGNG